MKIVYNLLIVIACFEITGCNDHSPSTTFGKAWAIGDFERSYWIDIDLRHNNGRGYWQNINDRSPDSLPTATEIENSCKALSTTYNGNKLYVTYHRQFELEDAKKVFSLWKKYGNQYGLTIVPTVVLQSYAKEEKLNFSDEEIIMFTKWCLENIDANEFGIYDVYVRHAEGSVQDIQMAAINQAVGNKLIRVGLQPGEKINQHIAGGVEDTWTAECQGITNELWEHPVTVHGTNKYGRLLLEEWILERINGENKRVVFNKIPVAWDYDEPVDSFGYVCPGDDALINDPPLKGRIELCDQYIAQWYKENNAMEKFYGYSCDLHILEANSYGKPERPSFYQQIKSNQEYKGYFSDAMLEIAGVYAKYK
ncbi:hypothetical protein [Gynurincola endophyticus]|uniref:hypothetical protein n=1 Tax=Gynurincola endophyticus TaxID=2479004 RepID=UPI000F8D9296|nr:hypothetical protein [Gynurincola endophyticus]